MEKFDLKKHNEKIFAFTKAAAKGGYPSKKIARIGSVTGSIIGIILITAGVGSTVSGSTWGIGSILAGVLTVMSNIINLKRIEKA